MKVAKKTQTRIIPFQHGVLGSFYRYWFKHQHPKISIQQAKGLEINKTDRIM